jgi:enterochelin esterase-like enzyme
MKKCQQQEKKVSVSQPPQTADLSRLKVHYFKDENGHFFLTLGEANLNRLIRNEQISAPAVIVERKINEVHIQAINGVLCREKRNPNHFRFYKPEELIQGKAEWTIPSDSEEIPIMILFDDKCINT